METTTKVSPQVSREELNKSYWLGVLAEHRQDFRRAVKNLRWLLNCVESGKFDAFKLEEFREEVEAAIYAYRAFESSIEEARTQNGIYLDDQEI